MNYLIPATVITLLLLGGCSDNDDQTSQYNPDNMPPTANSPLSDIASANPMSDSLDIEDQGQLSADIQARFGDDSSDPVMPRKGASLSDVIASTGD